MADFTLEADMIGLYEIPIPAGEIVTIKAGNNQSFGSIEIMVHASDKPVYVRPGETVTPRDAYSRMVEQRTWRDVPLFGFDTTIALICETAATISVYRS
jgi:hypothetical protein